MTRENLMQKTATAKDMARTIMQTMLDKLPYGQQKKMVKDEQIKAWFDLYGVQYE